MQLLSPPNMIFPGLVLGRDTGNGRFLLSLTPILVAIENPPLSSMKFPARNLHLQGIFHCHVWLSEGTSSMWRVSYIYNYVLIMCIYIYIYISACARHMHLFIGVSFLYPISVLPVSHLWPLFPSFLLSQRPNACMGMLQMLWWQIHLHSLSPWFGLSNNWVPPKSSSLSSFLPLYNISYMYLSTYLSYLLKSLS